MGTRIYVGKLNINARERDVERFFKGYGHVKEILMKNGFAFVEFEDYRDADDAIYELNGKEILGERVILEIARGPRRNSVGIYGSKRPSLWLNKYGPPIRTEHRVIVENLATRASWQDLKDYMRTVGEVTYADAHKERRNQGVVEFSSYSDMKTAIEKLNGTELSGRKIKITEDRSSDRRRSRRSRSRSRSRKSRSRSRSRSNDRSKDKRSPSKSVDTNGDKIVEIDIDIDLGPDGETIIE